MSRVFTYGEYQQDCVISIAIPAMNEAGTIERMLAAFAAQRELNGQALASSIFELVILANNCSDATVSVIDRFALAHSDLTIVVIDCTLPPENSHVGFARRCALDIAVERQFARHGSRGIVATTDADTWVDAQWIARTLVAMRDCDSVAGHVVIESTDLAAMPPFQRALYARERAYRELLGRMVAVFDPRPWDQWPRHDAFVGASFAVRVGAYRAAGGLPILPCLEDLAFKTALRRIDAKIRHSLDICVTTSARCVARVDGGFGSFLNHLRERGEQGNSFTVEHADRSVYRARARAALREAWSHAYEVERYAHAAALYRVPVSTLVDLVDPSRPFGETLDRTDGLPIWFEALPDQAVESASEALAAAIAASATRINVASGAG